MMDDDEGRAVALAERKLENPMQMSDRVYTPAMRVRTRRARQQIRNDRKDSYDRAWELRQMILQTLREHGFRVVLRPGDIGFHDDEAVDLVRAMTEGESDGAGS